MNFLKKIWPIKKAIDDAHKNLVHNQSLKNTLPLTAFPGRIEKKDEIEIVKIEVKDAKRVEPRNFTVKPMGTTKEQIDEAIADISKAMFENVKAGKAVVDAELKKRKAHYALQKAKERLNSLEQELMQ